MVTTKKQLIMDLFCGTGGFTQGFLNRSEEFDLVYAIDCNSAAANTSKANHSECLVENEDIRKVDPKSVRGALGKRDIDIIVGGPPCQGFSSLRPNRSSLEEDSRNNLFLSYSRFVSFFRPKVFVMENVVGLVTHDQGNTLTRIEETFSKLGYSIDWKILNAASYGVPQKRERFVLIGARDHAKVVFPEPTHCFNGKVIGVRDKRRFNLGDSSLPPALCVHDAISDLPPVGSGDEVSVYKGSTRNQYQRDRRKGLRNLTLHKAANHSEKILEIIKHSGSNIACIPQHLITSGFSSCYSRLNAKEPSTTITVKFQSPASSKCIHPSQNRAITPREAARIQSFDDDYVFSGSLTEIACQIGNAVPPMLGSAIAGSVLEMLR